MLGLCAAGLVLSLSACFESSAKNPRATDNPIPNVTFIPPEPRRDPGSGNDTEIGIIMVGAGTGYACAVRGNRTLWCWGADTSGRFLNNSAPANISSRSDWAFYDGGDGHSCGLTKDRAVLCWGANDYGQVGNGNLNIYRFPTQIPASNLTKDWTTVSAGGLHTCGIRQESSTVSTLWCWGRNINGQLGSSDTTDHWQPNQVGTDTTWQTVSAGGRHSCGLNNGKLYCWGDNTLGQLGHASINETLPSLVNASDWLQVSAGVEHSCAILNDQTLWCWGSNGYGQIGQGSATATYNAPIKVGVATNWTAISSGDYHTCALNNASELYCWGRNQAGQVGNGNTFIQASPVRIGADVEWASIAAGDIHTCGLDRFEALYCWGLNEEGQVGDGSALEYLTPTEFNTGKDWDMVRTGNTHTCAIKHNQSLWCGGLNEWGQLGTKTLAASPIPVEVEAGQQWADVSVGYFYTCAIKNTDGQLYCWGRNDRNQTGATNTSNTATNWSPVQETDVVTTWRRVVAGNIHTCALSSAQKLYCWGDDGIGQLGDGTAGGQTSIPTEVVHSTTWSQVALGPRHTCAVDTAKALYCWGDNASGQLGVGAIASTATPQQVNVAGVLWVSVATGSEHTCGLTENNRVYCWGSNRQRQLGDPTFVGTSSNTPILTQLASWDSIYARGNSSCGLTTNSQPFCWGDNSHMQLTSRLKDVEEPANPQAISFFSLWTDFSLSERHGCGIRTVDTKGLMYCWGRRATHQLGDGSGYRLRPVKLAL